MPAKCCLNPQPKEIPNVSWLCVQYYVFQWEGGGGSAMFQKQGKSMKNLNWPSTCIAMNIWLMWVSLVTIVDVTPSFGGEQGKAGL